MSVILQVLERAEKARATMNAACAAGHELPDETEFNRIETEWMEAQAELTIEVELALGVTAKRLVEVLTQ